MSTSHRLWADVPDTERIDRAFLETRVGASDPHWVQRHLNRVENPTCLMAVPWTRGRSTDPPEPLRWHPCGMSGARGEKFCHLHGGRTKFDKRPFRCRIGFHTWVKTKSRCKVCAYERMT